MFTIKSQLGEHKEKPSLSKVIYDSVTINFYKNTIFSGLFLVLSRIPHHSVPRPSCPHSDCGSHSRERLRYSDR